MTLAELMKANGVADDVIAKITAGMKENKIYTASEENLDIRYGKLKTDYDNLNAQHGESAKLIEQLKAGTKGNEALQGKITAHESTIAQLQEQLRQTQIESAVKVALMEAKATDIDYMTFKLKEKGEIEIGEDGKIRGIEDKIAGLKTQFPTQFEKANGSDIVPNPLPNGDNRGAGITKEQFAKMGYQSRLKLKNEQPDVYAQMTGKATE